jgi:hypothetical protein
MAIDYHRCKKDTTHKAIAYEFEIRGFSILDTSPLKNACDFVATNGEKTYFIECKSKNGKLSDGEIIFQNEFKAPVYNLESAQDAVNLLDLGLYICPRKIERQLTN